MTDSKDTATIKDAATLYSTIATRSQKKAKDYISILIKRERRLNK